MELRKFDDSQGRPWTIHVTVPVMYDFCAEHGLGMQDIWKKQMVNEKLCNVPALNAAQLIDLAYAGSRHCKRLQVEEQSKAQFLECLDGPAFYDCQKAAIEALGAFFRRLGPDKGQEAEENQSEKQETGPGDLSTDMQPGQESVSEIHTP